MESLANMQAVFFSSARHKDKCKAANSLDTCSSRPKGNNKTLYGDEAGSIESSNSGVLQVGGMLSTTPLALVARGMVNEHASFTLGSPKAGLGVPNSILSTARVVQGGIYLQD